MELRAEITFPKSRQPRLEIEFGEEESSDDSLTLGLKGVLNKTLADLLNVGYIFASETVAVGGFKNMQLDDATFFTETTLKLTGKNGELDNFFPEKVHSFRVFKLAGGSLGVQCKIELKGAFDPLVDFFRKHREGFTYSITPRQKELFEGGTRVDLSEVEPEKKRGRGRPKKFIAIDGSPVEQEQSTEEEIPVPFEPLIQ
jgi:hypothetical protein